MCLYQLPLASNECAARSAVARSVAGHRPEFSSLPRHDSAVVNYNAATKAFGVSRMGGQELGRVYVAMPGQHGTANRQAGTLPTAGTVLTTEVMTAVWVLAGLFTGAGRRPPRADTLRPSASPDQFPSALTMPVLLAVPGARAHMSMSAISAVP
jgi:hypothetical protein